MPTKRGFVSLVTASLLLLIGLDFPSALAGEPPLSVTFLEVGTADAAVVSTPGGEHVVIDGGTTEGGEKVASFLKKRGVKTLDAVIATHPHPDHIGGLAKILREFEVKTLYDSGMTYKCPEFEQYQKAMASFGGTLVTVCGRMIVRLPSGVHLDFLNPKRRGEDLHTDCIVVRLRCEGKSILFTGDMNEAAEQMALEDKVPLKSDILKVSHHGASDASTDAFLDAVHPKYAVIPVREPNKYGRPHKVVLDRLSKRGIEVFRTDEHGDVTFESDGKTWRQPKCERKPKGKAGS